MISEDDRRHMLRLARDAITAHLTGGTTPSVAVGGAAAQPGGAFVTLHCRGELRGCIGHIEPDAELGRTIVRCAVAAATADPRFHPVTPAEISELDIELSLLGPLHPIAGPDDIEIGRDGLVVESGWQRGLLLPQVATEWHWDRETFLAHTCHKAGLAADAWKHGAQLWRFEAEVFSETRGQGGQ